MSCGLSNTELIINAAIQSSSMPFSAKEAAMGIVPYMHKGEAIPNSEAGITPRTPSFLSRSEIKTECIFSFPNTETREPSAIPMIQYLKIC